MAAPKPAEAQSGPKRGSAKSTLLAAMLVTVLAVGAGALLATLNLQSPAPSAEERGLAAGAAAGCPMAASNLVDLPPVVTNLGAPTDTWVRLEASIVFDRKRVLQPEVMAAEIAADELAYLRTVSLGQISGPTGLANVRQDLTDRAVVRSGGRVIELVLKTLVVQ